MFTCQLKENEKVGSGEYYTWGRPGGGGQGREAGCQRPLPSFPPPSDAGELNKLVYICSADQIGVGSSVAALMVVSCERLSRSWRRRNVLDYSSGSLLNAYGDVHLVI